MFSWVDRTPQALALKSTRLEMSYSVFADTVRRVAAKLRQSGVRPGDIVGLRLEPELQAVFIAAVLHEGAVSFAAKQSNVQAYRAQINHVFTDNQLFEAGNPKRQLVTQDWLASTAAINAKLEPNDFETDQSLALLVFSSGTTGTPKGVAFTIANVLERIESAHSNWMPAKPFLAELGLDTVSGIQTYFYNLIHGETYLISTGAKATLELISSAGVQAIKTSPAKLLDLSREALQQQSTFDNLEIIQVAGGLISAHLGAEAAKAFSARLTYLYGSTEVGTVTRGLFDTEATNMVGTILPDSKVEIVDANRQPVPVGQNGAIRIKTPYQAKSYWNNAEKSATGFIDSWFYPGDTGRIDAKRQLHVDGRIDEMLNVGGAKLNPAWVDSMLSGYRGLQDAAAFTATDAVTGEAKLGLAIVTNGEINIEILKTNLRELLGGSAPEVIVRLNEIPKNELGKPLRLEIAKLYTDSIFKGKKEI